MPYLTEEEYKGMGFAEISKPLSFDNLLMKASAVLDNLTRDYYSRNTTLEEDYKWRADKFKQAVACQVEYFAQNNATTTSKMNDKPLTQQIGRTSISRGAKGQTTDNSKNSIVCEDVYIYLEGTGLLWRGVE